MGNDTLLQAAVRLRIRQLLQDSLLVPSECLGVDLVENGVIDSADFMELFLFIEEAFGIQVEAADLVLENFRTVDQMTAFVLSKVAGEATPVNKTILKNCGS
jgi:acyl carrier protein